MAIANQPAKGPAADLSEGLSGPAASPTPSIVVSDAPIAIPQASLLFDADFVRSGDDLTLVGHDGQELLIVDYFGAGAPDLIAPNHAMLDGQTVTLLAGPQFPGQYAQAGGATQPAEPIGSVETLQGTVTAQRADGKTHELKVGDPVFESDVVTTGPGSNIGMKLADGTLVTLQESGKLAINAFVYQADGADNSALLNVIQGTFSLFAGQVAPTGDMLIKTPIATMGIRGTSILGVNVDAILGRLSLTQDPDGHVGFIEIFNNQNGNLFTVLRTVFEKITISESGLLSLTPKTPEELSIDQTLTELLHDFYNQVPQQGPDTSPQPQSGSSRFETPNIQEILFAPTPPQGGEELLLPQELLEQFLESLLEIKEIRDEIILALSENPTAGEITLDDQPEGEGGDTGAGEGGGVIETTLPYDFGSSGPGSVGFKALHNQPVVDANDNPVTSGGAGEQLVYVWNATTNTLTAVIPGDPGAQDDILVFTIKVIPTTGQVTVTINGAVDHLKEDGNGDSLSMDIPFTVQAANGQTATGTLTVVVSDDVPIVGDLRGINEAGPDSGLEPAAALLNQTVEDALNTLPGNPGELTNVLDTVQAQVGDLARAIAVVWDFLDDSYVDAGPNQPNINEAFVRLGVAYAEYLQNDGVPLTDVTAKFTPDNDNNGDPERLQSLHDNLLGNLSTGALNQRFGPNGSDPNPTLYDVLKDLIENIDPDLLNRPYYAGNEGDDSSAAREWDLDNGFAPPKQGVVDEDDLADGSDAHKEPLCITRELAVDWGADDSDNDALGWATGDRTLSFDAALDGATPDGLTSNSEQITYTLSDGGTVLTASTCNGTVFTVSLNDDDSGSYTFTLQGNLDHWGTGEGNLFLDFGIVATDSDGDAANGSLTVAVTDDAPKVSNPEGSAPGVSNAIVDEADIGDQQADTATGNLKVDFGADGFGSTAFTAFEVPNAGSGTLTPDGEAIDSGLTSNGEGILFRLSSDGQTVEGYVAGGEGGSERIILRATLNESDAGYEVELLGNIDHQPGATGRGAGQSINFTVAASDADGDTIHVTLSTRIKDGEPQTSQADRYVDLNEADITSGNPDFASKSFNIDFGADGYGATAFTGAMKLDIGPGMDGNISFNVSEGPQTITEFTSNSRPITFELIDANTIRGYVASEDNGGEGDVTVLEMTLTDTDTSVTVTLFENVDHFAAADGAPIDKLRVDATVSFTDDDGDAVTSIVRADLHDDAPAAKGDVWAFKEAGPDGDLELADALLTQAVNNALDTLPDNPGGLKNVLATVRGEVGALAAAIVVVWDFLDDSYVLAGPNQANINEAFVRLGVEYANYVKDGGAPLTDVTAKFMGDNDNSGYPDRVQSLHDNLLGNLEEGVLNGRFSDDADLLSELKSLVQSVDPDGTHLLDRPYYGGYEGEDPAIARDWDTENGFASQQQGGFHGNVLANDDFGADGGEGVISLVVDGTVRTPENGDILEVMTLQGGKLTFNFATGDWEYLPASHDYLNGGQGNGGDQPLEYVDYDGLTYQQTPQLPYENFRYTIQDGDGDTSTASLTIVLDPEAVDQVHQGGEGNDVLDDGAADEVDVLVGGLGKDTFVLNALPGENGDVADFIADYNHNDEDDVIDLSALLDAYNATNDPVSSGDFLNSVSYNSETGDLSVDSTVVATVGNTPSNITVTVDDSGDTHTVNPVNV